MSRLKKAVTSGLVAGLFGLLLIPFIWKLEEDMGLDLLFKIRGSRDVPNDVVVITLDKDSAKSLNLPPEPYKWSRSLHARLVNNLVRQGAAVIAFDMIFKEPSTFDIDNQFAEAIGNAGNVVLCEQLDKETITLLDGDGEHTNNLEIESLVPLVPSIAQAASAAAPFPLPKVPVKVSQYWTFKTSAGDLPTFPVVAFQVFALDVYNDFLRLMKNVDPVRAQTLPQNKNAVIAAKGIQKLVQVLRDFFRLDQNLSDRMLQELGSEGFASTDLKRRIILKSLIKMYQGGNSHYLNYYGPPGTIPTVPYHLMINQPVINSYEGDSIDLRGKAVFVGLSERLRPEEKDGFYTAYSQSSGVDISGVEIAATAFSNLMEDAHVRPLSLTAQMLMILIIGLVLGVFCRVFSAVVSATGVFAMGVLYLASAYYQFKTSCLWLPLVLPICFQAPFAVFGNILWKYFETHKERQNVKKALGYYVPGGVVDQMAKNMKDIRASREMFHGTLLCTDAENYTTLAETLKPDSLAEVMDKYFETIFEPVKKNSGMISEVVADSMIAVWEASELDTAHRLQACHAALGIAAAVNRFNRDHKFFQLPTRMGLHSGRIMIGNIGAIDRYEYNPIGDIVNTASRIESLNKHLGTGILASQDVLHGLDDLLTRDLGQFVFAGKSKPVAVSELICRKGEARKQHERLCAMFHEALEAYKNKSLADAIKIFSAVLKINVGDGPAGFYLKLCHRFMENPSAETWDWVIRMDKK